MRHQLSAPTLVRLARPQLKYPQHCCTLAQQTRFTPDCTLHLCRKVVEMGCHLDVLGER